MAGIFVRGLTGNKVNVFVDGVRYSNGAQRGGVNTFLDLIDPSTLEGIEVLRGPNSAQYGSDALGGSVQFLSRVPALSSRASRQLVRQPDRRRRSRRASGRTSARSRSASAAKRFAMLRQRLAGADSGDYRPGGGIDSHAAVTRFFGLPSTSSTAERLPDTGFEQIRRQQCRELGGLAPDNAAGAFNYMRTRQDDGNRYDQTARRRRQPDRRAERPRARPRSRAAREG